MNDANIALMAAEDLLHFAQGCCFATILADPPWQFEPYNADTGSDRAAGNHYPTMTLDDIAAFKLPERLELMSEFPLSPVGKILKRQLREIVEGRLGAGAPPNPT